MKKSFLTFAIIGLLFVFAGCKKCFTCANECVRCTLSDSTQTVSQVLCSDSFNTEEQFRAAIAADSALGFQCSATASTYSYDFCVNKPGEEDYLNYYNKGRRVPCNEK